MTKKTRFTPIDFHCNLKQQNFDFIVGRNNGSPVFCTSLDSVFSTETQCFPPDPMFPTRPRVSHETPCFPHLVFSTLRVFHTLCFPHPVFSTPRVFHTPGPRTPYSRTPAPRFPPSLSGNIEAPFFILGTRNIYRKKENNNKNKNFHAVLSDFSFSRHYLP